MAEELDVEELLEATYNKTQPLPKVEDVINKSSFNNDNDHQVEDNSNHDPPADKEKDDTSKYDSKRHKKKKRSRSRSKSRSRSPSRRRRRSHSRDRYRDHRKKSPHSKDRRRRHSKDRDSDKKHLEKPKSPPRQSVATPIGSYRRARSPDLQAPSLDRDSRTVMCMQLGAKVTNKDLEDFFIKAGAVRDVHIIADRQSRRSKGIAYIEFQEESSIPLALQLNGHRLHGIPIMVQPTMSEKNRLAAAAESLKKAEGPKKLYVGSLHHNINEDMLHGIFSPFGNVERVSIMRDSITNISRGYAFVEFRESDSAEKAMSTLNNFELAGQQIKVNYGTVDTSIINIDSLDGEDMDVGVGMTPQSRVALMHKLAEGHNANILPPGYSSTSIPISSCCLVIGNMFDPAKETGTDWDREIHDDVLEECMKIGTILHVHVDKFSQGNVYVKCQNNLTASQVIVSFAGRQYAGNYITAELMSESTYHLKFPGAIAAIVPLRL